MSYIIKLLLTAILFAFIIISCEENTQSSSTFTPYTLSSVEWYSNIDCTGDGINGNCIAADSTNFYGYFCMVDMVTSEYVTESDCATITIVDSVDATDDSCIWQSYVEYLFDNQATPAITIHDDGTIAANWGDDTATGSWVESSGLITITMNFSAEEYTDTNGDGAYDIGEEFIDINNNAEWDDASTETMVFTQSGTTLTSQVSDSEYQECVRYLFTAD